MSLKFDKVFIKGLLKTDEQNQALYIAPIFACILGAIGIGLVCWLFSIVANNQPTTDPTLIVWTLTAISAIVSLAIFSDLNIYSQEKLIPQLSPEDCVPNKKGYSKKIMMLKLPLLASINPFLIPLAYLESIENGVLSVSTLISSLLVVFFIAWSVKPCGSAQGYKRPPQGVNEVSVVAQYTV